MVNEKKQQKDIHVIFAIVFMCFAIIVAVLPFFGREFIPTHDGEFHFIRFAEFYRMLESGYWFPRWAPTINSGYGLPVFEFLYPFANYVSALLHIIGMEFVDSFKINSALGYIGAACFCFLWLRKRFGVFPAAIGTVVSSYVPYWFVELYVRGSIGEVWALAFVFMALWSVEAKLPILFVTAIAGIILSHNILTLIFGPFLLLYLIWRRDWKWIPLLVLGGGLASWFWLPALAESQYMQGLNTVNFKDHFASIAELIIPSWGTGFSGSGFIANKMSFQIGLGPIVWILIAIALLLTKKVKGLGKNELIGIFGVMLCALGMTLPLSMKIWESIPIIQYVQHPWRYLAFLIPLIGYISAFVSVTIKKKWFVIILAICSMAFSFSYTRGALYEPRNDAHYLTNTNFIDSASSMGNSLTTIWTPWKEKRSNYMVTDTSDRIIPVEVVKNMYVDKTYTVELERPTLVRFHILYFPGWTAYLDGVETPIDYTRNGTLDIFVPEGVHVITVKMIETPIRLLADSLSFMSLVITLGLSILLYIKRKKV